MQKTPIFSPKRFFKNSSTFRIIFSLAFVAIMPKVAWGSGGIGDQNDDYSKPCASTSILEVEFCGPLTTTMIGADMYVSLDFFFRYNYLYKPEGADPLNPMYMELSFVDGNKTSLDLYSDPQKLYANDKPTLLGKKLMLSAAFIQKKEKGNSHRFYIPLYIKATDLNIELGVPQIYFNFFDMYEKADIVSEQGIPLDQIKNRKTGDIVVYPDGSYYHYEEHVETILNLSACTFPQVANFAPFVTHTNSDRVLKAQLNPNPILESVELMYEQEEPGLIQINLYDASGKKIQFPFSKEVKEVGIYREVLDVSNLAPGLYFLHLHTKNSSNTLKLIKK